MKAIRITDNQHERMPEIKQNKSITQQDIYACPECNKIDIDNSAIKSENYDSKMFFEGNWDSWCCDHCDKSFHESCFPAPSPIKENEIDTKGRVEATHTVILCEECLSFVKKRENVFVVKTTSPEYDRIKELDPKKQDKIWQKAELKYFDNQRDAQSFLQLLKYKIRCHNYEKYFDMKGFYWAEVKYEWN